MSVEVRETGVLAVSRPVLNPLVAANPVPDRSSPATHDGPDRGNPIWQGGGW
jgi:hypothetical protein